MCCFQKWLINDPMLSPWTRFFNKRILNYVTQTSGVGSCHEPSFLTVLQRTWSYRWFARRRIKNKCIIRALVIRPNIFATRRKSISSWPTNSSLFLACKDRAPSGNCPRSDIRECSNPVRLGGVNAFFRKTKVFIFYKKFSFFTKILVFLFLSLGLGRLEAFILYVIRFFMFSAESFLLWNLVAFHFFVKSCWKF